MSMYVEDRDLCMYTLWRYVCKRIMKTCMQILCTYCRGTHLDHSFMIYVVHVDVCMYIHYRGIYVKALWRYLCRSSSYVCSSEYARIHEVYT